jgi:hypothetical protein
MSSLQVWIFQITPFTEKVTEYVNSLSIDELYRIFNENTTYDVCTAALMTISQLSPNIIDNLLFKGNINELVNAPYVFVFLLDGKYIDHYYVWLVTNQSNGDTVTNIYHMIYKENVVPLSIAVVKSWTESIISTRNESKFKNSHHYIRFIQPNDNTAAILSNYRFVSAKSMRNNHRNDWLFENGSLNDMPITKYSLFREYDYIADFIVL